MDNVWVSETDGDDKIIAIDAEYVYKCSPRQPRLSSELIDPQFIEETKNYYRIPVSYIKKIVLKENKKYIQVFFGKDSEERLRILDPEKRKEIFDFLRQYFLTLNIRPIHQHSSTLAKNRELPYSSWSFFIYGR